VQITLHLGPGDPPLSNTAIFEDQGASFSAAGTGYASWKWYWDGLPISGETSPTYNLAANTHGPGIYELSVLVTTRRRRNAVGAVPGLPLMPNKEAHHEQKKVIRRRGGFPAAAFYKL
jgi:hypothetical protein